MKNSAMLIFIVLGNDVSMPDGVNEIPEIGLFKVYNAVTMRHENTLVYADDIVRGTGSSSLKYALGYLPKNGVGEISESGNFRFGGGSIQNRQVSFELRNTNGLMGSLDALKTSLMGKQLYVVDYSWSNDVNSQSIVSPLPMFAGRIGDITWDTTLIKFSAAPDFERSRSGNLMHVADNGVKLPVTFGILDHGVNVRAGDPVFLPQSVFTGHPDDDRNHVYAVTRWGRSALRNEAGENTGQYYMWLGLRINRDLPWSWRDGFRERLLK
jgi:hypothetical protein